MVESIQLRFIIHITAEFLGEQGSDTGGLTREFLRLVGQHATKPSGCFKHNSVALQVQYLGLSYVGQPLHNYAMYLFRSNSANAQDGLYFWLGQLKAMVLIHGGAAVHMLSPSVFNCLSGTKPINSIEIDEESDADI